jgi:hypothetical protein
MLTENRSVSCCHGCISALCHVLERGVGCGRAGTVWMVRMNSLGAGAAGGLHDRLSRHAADSCAVPMPLEHEDAHGLRRTHLLAVDNVDVGQHVGKQLVTDFDDAVP